MEALWLENSSVDMKSLIKELNGGQQFANQLKEVIKKPLGDRGTTMLAEDLIGKIMISFCKTLSILNSNELDEVYSQVPLMAVSPTGEDDHKFSVYSTGNTCKTLSPKSQRRCNKRRKISKTSVKESSTLLDDGHVWRKYGQKEILDAPYPRNYYRCTYKFDHGCEATKLVQRIQDKPPRFRTTYQGHHTCKTYPTVSQILLDSSVEEDSSVLLCFDSNVSNNHQPNVPSFPSTKQETKEDVSLGYLYPNIDQNQPSKFDCYLSSDDYSALTTFEASGNIEAGFSSWCDHDDVISSGVYSSCITSTSNLEMEIDMMMGSVDFEDFSFDFSKVDFSQNISCLQGEG